MPVPGPTMIIGASAVCRRAEVRRLLHEDRHVGLVAVIGEERRAHPGAVLARVVVAHRGDGQLHLAGVDLGAGGDRVQPRLQAFEDAQPLLGVGVDRDFAEHVDGLPAPQPLLRARSCSPGAAASPARGRWVRSCDEPQQLGGDLGDLELAAQRLAQRHLRRGPATSTACSASSPVTSSHSSTTATLLVGRTPSASPAW